ncbi:MAG: hypothetical protein WAU58_15225 [Terriglobales bacterium]
MRRILAAIILLGASFAMAGDTGGDGADSAPARDFWRKFQFHGNLDQSVAYGSGNNYLTMDTNDGTAKWTEGSVNLSFPITENLHAGVQVHDYMMGQLGRGNLMLDWAYGDYRVKNWLGFRGGKIKAPMGLFNETSDNDVLHNWALLPQGVYEAENRSYNIPVVGGAIYGNIDLPVGGNVSYQLFGGRRSVSSNDGGFLLARQLYGIVISNESGYTYGGAIKWRTPIKGFTAGISFDNARVIDPDALWPANANPYGLPLTLAIDVAISRQIYSVEYRRGKLNLAAEGKIEPHWVANNGAPVSPTGSWRHAWYVMGDYHLTGKLTAGSYFSRTTGTGFVATFAWASYDPNNPNYYSNDTVANARYDINRFFYIKLEGHYIDGDLAAFFPGTNPNGLQKVTRIGIARIGFVF